MMGLRGELFITLAIALAFLSLGGIDIVAQITGFGSLITFVLVNPALLHLRRVAPNMNGPVRAPLGMGRRKRPGFLPCATDAV